MLRRNRSCRTSRGAVLTIVWEHVRVVDLILADSTGACLRWEIWLPKPEGTEAFIS